MTRPSGQLAAWRYMVGLRSRSVLAKRVGISVDYVAKIEAGRKDWRAMKIGICDRWATVVNCSLPEWVRAAEADRLAYLTRGNG